MRALLLALLCTAAQAEPWTPEEQGLALTSAALLVADYGQTREIAAEPTRWREYNPILGRHPSLSRVNRYFFLAPVVSFLVLDSLPNRTWPLRVLTALEAGVVGRNAYIGIHTRF